MRMSSGHWLKFGTAAEKGHGPIVGCQCGFRSNLGDSCGWGDDVVDHIAQVAREMCPSADLSADQTSGEGMGADERNRL